MKEILAHIEMKKQEFAKLPLFEYMRDTSIDPRQRLAWTPCAAPFAMGFAELNKNVFRDNKTNDPVQKIINQHTREDDHHWLWFLEDIKKLEMNRSLEFNDALRFLWSEETRIPRWVIYELYRYTFEASTIQKLVVIEVIEATGHVLSSIAVSVSQELKKTNNKNLLYFGDVHLSVENGHVIGLSEINQFMEEIEFTQENINYYLGLAENIFDLFTELTNSLLLYAQTHKIDKFAKSA
ncbi:hypothetical protein [Rivularia sp. UHCC 0363]|uniref:hypothetical protein n=1 Tax=Rivularia sp. UHCC 0363 TaxID=3110244 RepID=UPI002B208D68|nr:hypothetical protein [Rivularia sp. UHCC 0363]MEA5594230.1 hypothetical protein [Rivularia sp. UHCC 0363]